MFTFKNLHNYFAISHQITIAPHPNSPISIQLRPIHRKKIVFSCLDEPFNFLEKTDQKFHTQYLYLNICSINYRDLYITFPLLFLPYLSYFLSFFISSINYHNIFFPKNFPFFPQNTLK
jgi:hypothetical protein